MTRPGVLVTRPADQGQALADILHAKGFRPIPAPSLRVETIDGPPLDLGGIAALAVTSATGAAALARRTDRRDLPVFAVGQTTADAARASGFRQVIAAGGDVCALEQEIVRHLSVEAGAILHVSGEEVAGDLVGALRRAGFAVSRQIVYRAIPTAGLPSEAVAAITDGQVSAVLLMSARTATVFGQQVEDAGIADGLAHLDALCLSEAVAAAARSRPYREVLVADTPTQAALIELLETCHPHA